METTKKSSSRRILKIFIWLLLVLIVLYFIAAFVRAGQLRDLAKANAQVVKIHNTKLTLDDVMRKNLPPDPGAMADKTVAGVDANNNGIRDDVELAVFKAYSDSAKTRAVLLQYALALQMETTQPIVDTITATEVVREQSRGFECIGNIIPRDNSQKFDEATDLLTNFIKDKQFNTIERKNARNNFLENVRSYSDLNRICDIDYSKLLN